MGVTREVGRLVEAVLGLSPAMREQFLFKLQAEEAEESFGGARAALPAPERCPRCGDPRMAKRGRDARGRQRWLCGGCRRSFTAEAGCVASRSPLPVATWAAFCRAFAARLPLRECAHECGASLKTAWYMRARACGVIRREGAARPVAGDVAQGDEAYPPESFSGRHAGNPAFKPLREPRRRGGGDVPKECLLTIVGEGSASDFRVADAGVVAETAEHQVRDVVGPSVRVGCEMHSSVGSAAAALGREVSRSYSAERRLNPLNSVHSAMKSFMARFRGVSSRRMQLHLDWFSWHSGFRGPSAGRDRLAALVPLVAVGRWDGSQARLFRQPYPAQRRAAAKRDAEVSRNVSRTSREG